MKKLGKRWGQWLCFAIGGAMTLGSMGRYTDLAMIAYALGGAAFLFTGVGLRAIAIWREVRTDQSDN